MKSGTERRTRTGQTLAWVLLANAVVFAFRAGAAHGALANFIPVIALNVAAACVCLAALLLSRAEAQRLKPHLWAGLFGIASIAAEALAFYPRFLTGSTWMILLAASGTAAAILAAAIVVSDSSVLTWFAAAGATIACSALLGPFFREPLVGWVVPGVLAAGILLIIGLFMRLQRAQRDTVEAHRIQAELSERLATSSAEILDSRHRESLSMVAAGIVHEINNPINYLRGNVELLREEIGDGPPREMLGDIEAGLASISDVVARVQSMFKGARQAPRSVVVRDAANTAITTLPLQANRTVDIRNEIPADMVAIAHPADIYIVLANLLRNAMDAVSGRDDARVIVTAASSGDEVTISVVDNGRGMTEDELAECRAPFYTTKHDRNGMGVGLALCETIAHRSGARLEITSRLNHGTTANFTLKGASS